MLKQVQHDLFLKNSRILQELNFYDKKAYKIVGEKDVLVPSRATIVGWLASYTSIGMTKKKSKKSASLGGMGIY